MYLRSVCAKAPTAAICRKNTGSRSDARPFKIKFQVFSYLSLDHSLWNSIHGITEPTFQAFGEVANGLSQGTYKQTTGH